MAVRAKISGENFGWEAYNRAFQGPTTEAIMIDGNTGGVTIDTPVAFGSNVTFSGKHAAAPNANLIADPGTGHAIPVTTSGSVKLVIGSAGAETNTAAIPSFIGQVLDIYADTVGSGTRAITFAQAINAAGNTVATFNGAWDRLRLTAITIAGALRWTVDVNTSVTLA